MTPEEELAKIRRHHQSDRLTDDAGNGFLWCWPCQSSGPCIVTRALTLAAQLAREHTLMLCGKGCGDIIARKIEGAK